VDSTKEWNNNFLANRGDSLPVQTPWYRRLSKEHKGLLDEGDGGENRSPSLNT
jgi:hypothetical protein